MPPQSQLSFELAWKDSLRFRLLLSSDEGPDPRPDNCYDLVFQRRYLYLRKRWQTRDTGGSRILGQAEVRALMEGERARIDIFHDRDDGRIALLIRVEGDGGTPEVLQVFTDKDSAVGEFGDWVQFVAQEGHAVGISELRAKPWDGRMPEVAEK